MSPLAGLRAIALDPVLRLSTIALIGWGVVMASVAPYQSLIGIKLMHLPTTAYAAVMIAAALVSVTSSIVAGILADQRGWRRQVAITLGITLTLGVALMRFVPAPVTFALTHGLLVPMSAGLYGQLFALSRIAAITRPAAERDRISALTRAAVSLPFVTVLPLWAMAVRSGVPILDTYSLGLVAALIVLALVVRQWPADADLPGHAPSGLSFRAALAELAHPAVLWRVVALGMTVSGVSIYMVILGPMFSATGRNVGLVALFAGIVAGLEIPSMMIGASLVARFPRTKVIVLGAIVYAGFLLSFAASAHFGPVLLLTLPAGFGAGLLLMIPIGYVQDLLGHRPGAGGALIAVHQFLMTAFAALAFAVGTALGGYALAALISAGFVLSGAALLTWLDRRHDAPVPG
ncbi:MAG: hypothetical protein KGK00_01560 [Paracoccaceae bacterium]|nr:hypothetical protein [Paracoccaceae bacterium]